MLYKKYKRRCVWKIKKGDEVGVLYQNKEKIYRKSNRYFFIEYNDWYVK